MLSSWQRQLTTAHNRITYRYTWVETETYDGIETLNKLRAECWDCLCISFVVSDRRSDDIQPLSHSNCLGWCYSSYSIRCYALPFERNHLLRSLWSHSPKKREDVIRLLTAPMEASSFSINSHRQEKHSIQWVWQRISVAQEKTCAGQQKLFVWLIGFVREMRGKKDFFVWWLWILYFSFEFNQQSSLLTKLSH